jgi:hypothetical protein
MSDPYVIDIFIRKDSHFQITRLCYAGHMLGHANNLEPRTREGSVANEVIQTHTYYHKFAENGLLPISEAQSDLFTSVEMTSPPPLPKREGKTSL